MYNLLVAGHGGAALGGVALRGFRWRLGTPAWLVALFLAGAVPARAAASLCANVPPLDPQALPCSVARHEPAPDARPGAVRVVTFNVHYGADVPGLVRAIRANPRLSQADVLLIQEIESHPGDDRAARLAEALSLNLVYAPARIEGDGTHGLAILSRYPMKDLEVLKLKKYDLGFRGTRRRIAMAATVDLPGRSVRIYNVHLDTRLTPEERLLQLEPVIAEAVKQPAALVGGDFNTINAVSSLLPLVPVPLPGFSQAGGLDAYMRSKGFATPFERIGSTHRFPMRLDAVYARGLEVEAEGKETSVTVSDHYPLWVDLKVH
jgi:endonuclease/exonuclease/phosphatase family metal-dependent hydrolase